MNIIPGGVCAAKGFKANGIHCGIRKNRTKRDLALIVSEKRAAAAGVYTTNLVKGAPNVVTKKNISDGYIVSKRDLDETFELITNYSPYAFQNEIKNGFITVTGGHRVGLCGKTVIQDNKIKTIKNICSINFRVAHQIKNCAQSIIKFITKPVVSGLLDSDKKKSSNILI